MPTTSTPGERRCAGALLEVAHAHLEGRPRARAAVRSVIACPRASRVRPPVRSATATRNSSERRMVRAAEHRRGRVVLATRPPTASVAAGRSRDRGCSPRSRRGTARTPAPARAGRRRTGCGPGCAPDARRPTPRRAAACRYQCVEPSSSLILRKASSPASGSASSANQPSMTGSSVRWMAARRLMPVGQRLEVAQRAARVAEAERRAAARARPRG